VAPPPLGLRGLRAEDLRVVLRAGLAAPVARFAAGLRAVDARLLAPADDVARVDPDVFAVLRLAVERLAVERFAVDRFAVDRLALDLRAPPPAPDDDADEPLLVLALPSIDHLPVITR